MLAATGILSATLDRRALLGTVPDWHDTIGFGLALALLLMATRRRPVRGTSHIALAALGVELLLGASGAGIVAIVLYLGLAYAGARLCAAPHLRPLAVGAFALWTPVLWIAGGSAGPVALGPLLWLAALVAIAASVAALADRRRTHPSERLRRAGYAIAAVAVAGASAARTLVVAGQGAALLDALTLAGVLALVALSYLRMRAPLRDALATAAALTVFALIGMAYVAGTPYGNDAVAAPHHAAELLLRGQDPYASFVTADALARFGLDPQLATHLENGDTVRTYSYPALSFLSVAPFVWAGVGDIRWLDLAVVIAIALVAARAVRPAWRPMVLASVVGNEVVVRQNVLAGVDPLWALLVAEAWLLRRSLWGAALLGLALADRQLAWFVFPFFLATVARQRSARDALRAGAVALAVALALHVPFLADAPGRTVEGILAPLLAPIVADGVGIMQLGVTDRYATLFPRIVYTLVAAGVFLALLAMLWRRARDVVAGALVWPFVPLFFAWRSLQNYFGFMPVFALVADDEIARDADDGAAPRDEGGAAA